MKKQRKGLNAKTAGEIHQQINDFALWVYAWKRGAAIEAADYELRSFCCGRLAEPFTEQPPTTK